jgi:predicted DNA-binding transcriptional regulator YafY
MSESQPVLVRQWRLLRLLSAHPAGLALRELATALEVSQKTVRRDLGLFQRVGFPLQEIVGPHGAKHWRIGPAGGEIPLGFTFDEALAMYLGRQSLQPLAGTLIAEAAARAFGKLQAAFGPRVVRYLEKMRGLFIETAFGVTDYSAHAEILDRLMIAIEERRVVFIAYRSQRATEPVTYDVHPYRLLRHQGTLYLVGYKPMDDAVRTWRVDRIEQADVERMPFTVPADLDLDARFAGSLGIYEGHDDIAVTLRFRPPAARFVQEKKWHTSQRFLPQRDGSLIAELRLSSTAELKPWVLGFGPAAEVLQPASLRAEIAADLQQMLTAYAAPPDQPPAPNEPRKTRKIPTTT